MFTCVRFYQSMSKLHEQDKTWIFYAKYQISQIVLLPVWKIKKKLKNVYVVVILIILACMVIMSQTTSSNVQTKL